MDLKLYENNYHGNLAHSISELVREKMEVLNIAGRDLARRISEELKFSRAATESLISFVKNGYTNYYLPERIKTETDKKRLYRLSAILYSLNIDKKDPVIEEIRKFYNGEFTYPPQKVNTQDSLEKNLKNLKSEDREWIERLVGNIIRSYK